MTLPDFRNLGVILRCLIIGEGASLVGLVVYSPDGFFAWRRLFDSGLLFESTLLFVLGLLFICSRLLRALPYRLGVVLVLGLSAVVAVLLDGALRISVGEPFATGAARAGMVSVLLTGLILAYFNWRQCALSPSIAESRLIALQSRIRPHFLFNSLNTAVSLVRQDPVLAERVLLDMAELFRALVAERRSLVPLGDEIRVGRSYLEIEQIRLGGRLRVDWDVGEVQADVLLPLLVLQPLLENAVRYGIEPAESGGEVQIRVRETKRRLEIEVRNTLSLSSTPPPSGNRMALANIEERLALHFDAEGTVVTSSDTGSYSVRLNIPVTRERR